MYLVNYRWPLTTYFKKYLATENFIIPKKKTIVFLRCWRKFISKNSNEDTRYFQTKNIPENSKLCLVFCFQPVDLKVPLKLSEKNNWYHFKSILFKKISPTLCFTLWNFFKKNNNVDLNTLTILACAPTGGYNKAFKFQAGICLWQ